MASTRFTDKIALVTGAAAGIGKAAALTFAREGAKVVVSDVDQDRGASVAHQINEDGGTAVFIRADVSQDGDVQGLIEQTVGRFDRLDIAFNNAGIEGQTGALHEMSEATFERVLGVNLRGVFLCMKYEITQMLEQADGGNIINMSSVAGLQGFGQLSPYVASKHGVLGLTKSAALEYAKQNIRVNAVCPGAIETEMIHRVAHHNPEEEAAFAALQPIGRMGTSEEVANLVAWLASDEASFMTGAIIPVDGGIMAG